MSSIRQYRPGVDGLRAVAVIAVVLFHIDMPFISGGYIGVDVFYVISGFLISGIIIEARQNGTWSVRDFYVRRTKRLIPALLATLLFSFALAFLLFTPSHFAIFADSLVSALFAVSNIYFYLKSGYFDAASEIKPLLHTWSLSVEWQFYLIWPLLLIVLLSGFGKRWLWIWLVLIGGMSLAFSQAFVRYEPSAAFYLTVFRIFEFVTGAFAYLAVDTSFAKRWHAELLSVTGLGLILVPTVLFDDTTPFPGINALIPCVGAALLIITEGKSRGARLLSAGPLVWIGKLSYSIYLVHWPLLVFFRYYTHRPPDLFDKLLLISLTLLLSSLMYRYIETPFRKRPLRSFGQSRYARGTLAAGLVVILVLLPLHAGLTDGWSWRVATVNERGNSKGIEYASECARKTRTPGCFINPDATSPLKILLIGDSHGDHFSTGLERVAKKYDVTIHRWVSAACPPLAGVTFAERTASKETIDRCGRVMKAWARHIIWNDIDIVILASRWAIFYEPSSYGNFVVPNRRLVEKNNPDTTPEDARELFARKLHGTLRELTKRGIKVVLFSQVPPVGTYTDTCTSVPNYLPKFHSSLDSCISISYDDVVSRMRFTDETMKKMGDRFENVFPVIFTDMFCNPSTRTCSFFDREIALHRDNNHLSIAGSLFVMPAYENILAEQILGAGNSRLAAE